MKGILNKWAPGNAGISEALRFSVPNQNKGNKTTAVPTTTKISQGLSLGGANIGHW